MLIIVVWKWMILVLFVILCLIFVLMEFIYIGLCVCGFFINVDKMFVFGVFVWFKKIFGLGSSEVWKGLVMFILLGWYLLKYG